MEAGVEGAEERAQVVRAGKLLSIITFIILIAHITHEIIRRGDTRFNTL